ncbi:MAG TPA: hypothetical protein VFB96_22325 [Pirellulaceae bacterium]|nr:hypothetical protein [Pirellulaceae bacterium]
MSQFNLKDKFPSLEPIQSPPSLYTINGIGTGIYGRRDYDPETGTYVSTLCFCVLFVPLFAMRAYRIADAGHQRYYFLGREPLSAFAKAWNVTLALVALIAIGWGGFQAWYFSEGAIAARKLREAERLTQAGRVGEAAAKYKELVLDEAPNQHIAELTLFQWLSKPPAKASPKDRVEIWRAAVALSRAGRSTFRPDMLATSALELAGAIADVEPRSALALLEESSEFLADPKARVQQTRPILERVQKQLPGDVGAAVQLAITYELEGDDKTCERILAPLADKLGDSEGARILGQIAASRGEFDKAYGLLTKYCQQRLEKFRASEARWAGEIERIEREALAELRTGKAPLFDFTRYEQSPEDQQQEMVSEFIENRIKRDPDANTLREQFAAETRVVPVALDLGMLQLQRGQGLQGDERKAELERAEKTFLAIRNVASDAPGYKLSLGKVYYWLGKLDEGKKIFDEALAAAGNDFQQRVAVAIALREVGAESEARALSEKLYETFVDLDQKAYVARVRAALFKSLEDEIFWLERASQADPEVKASLNQAKGRKALADGNQEEGIRLLRLAAEAYAAMPASSMSLNNGALCYQGLFQASGRRVDLDEAGRMLDKAASLQPDDSILTVNAGEVNLTRALAEILEPHVYLETLSLDSGLDLVRFLYEDAAGRQKIVDQLQASPVLARAVQLLERAILLAPKRADNYDNLLSLYAYLEDSASLKRVQQRIEEVDPDVSRKRTEAIESAQGTKREDYLKKLRVAEDNCRRLYDRWKAEPSEARRNRSLSIVAGQIVTYKIARQMMSDPVDVDQLVKLAEEGVALAPSTAAQYRLVYALQARAHQELTARDAAYARFAAATKHVLHPSLTVQLSLEHDALRPIVLAHPDVRRAAEVFAAEHQRFSKTPSTWDWLMLRHTHPEVAESLKAAALADEVDRVSQEIDIRLYPFSINAVWRQYAYLRCAGRDEDARNLWKKLREEGIPLGDEVVPP